MLHLVTGGSGFIGNLIARKLLAAGNRVRVFDTWSDASRPGGIEFVKASVLDRDAVKSALTGVDVVHHAAGLVAQTRAGKSYQQVNAHGTLIVAEEAVIAGVLAIVHLSTTAVFGLPPDGPITNDTQLCPIEDYGRSKLAGEQAMERICRASGMPLITIRPRAALGAGRLGIFQILFDWVKDGRNVYVIGDGNQPMQFIHADDLIEFYMLALELQRPGTYNVGTDSFGTLRNDLTALIQHVGSPARIIGLSPLLAINALRTLHHLRLSPLVPWHYLTYHRACYFDVAPLLAMGWRPKYSNEQMLIESYDWFATMQPGEFSESGSPHRTPLGQAALKIAKLMS